MAFHRLARAHSIPILRPLAIALSIVYAAWNIAWLAGGQVPPALFRALTGLPAPTTGGVHGIRALMSGDWRHSLAWNPMAVPLLAFFLFSLAWIASQALRRRALRLPGWALPAWCVLLGAAWMLKFAGSPLYW